MRRALLLGIVLVSAPAHAEQMCSTGPLPAQGSFAQSKVAGSGGVIVAGDAMPDWRFRDVNRVVRPRVTVVAPGLALYHPPPVADVEVTLEDSVHEVRVRRPRVLKADPPLAAPAIKRIALTENIPQKRGFATVELADGNVPQGAIIAVITRVEGAKRTPLAWAYARGDVKPGFQVWHTPFTCEQFVTATIPPKVGETVDITWLDDSGRLSEPSNQVKVVRAKEAK